MEYNSSAVCGAFHEADPGGPWFTEKTDLIDSLRLQIERLDNGDIVHAVTLQGRFDSPMQDIRVRLRIRDLMFPVAGIYEIALFADNELIAHRRLVLAAREEKP